MKCLIRIPLASWVVKYYRFQHRDRLDADGVTVNQTAKDMLGKIISGYMRKTAFEPWYFPKGNESHLRVNLPLKYNKHGLTEQDLKNLSDILMDLAQRDICFKVACIASNGGISRESAIRGLFKQIGINDDDYDPSHFRRYFDRYGSKHLGVNFDEFRSNITQILKEYFSVEFAAFIMNADR